MYKVKNILWRYVVKFKNMELQNKAAVKVAWRHENLLKFVAHTSAPPGGGGGGVLPYMGSTGMCRSTGYVFCFSDSGTGYKNRTFSLEQGIFYFRFDSGIVSNFP